MAELNFPHRTQIHIAIEAEIEALQLARQSLYVNRAVRACYISLFFDIAILYSQYNHQQSLPIHVLKGDDLSEMIRSCFD